MNCAIDKSLLESCEPTAELTAAELTLISSWLDDFEADPDKRLAIDQSFRLWSDYEPFGLQNRAALILQYKLDMGRFEVPVTAPAGALPAVDPAWAHLDEHRTLLLAVALAPLPAMMIVNATHVEWEATRLPTTQPLPAIHQVLEAWLTAQVRGLTPPEVEGNYEPPPELLEGALAGAEPKGHGTNKRKAWEDADRRYEWDYQHGCVEVYSLATGAWLYEAKPDGTITKTTGGKGRRWGRR